MSRFSQWFEQQHGPRSHMKETDEELRARVSLGDSAQLELARRTIWDGKRQSALYAWTARDPDRQAP